MRNGENGSADIRCSEVHFAVRIFENTEAGNLFGQVVGIGFGVGLRDTEQDEQTKNDFAGDFAGNGDAGAGDTLDDGAHKRIL